MFTEVMIRVDESLSLSGHILSLQHPMAWVIFVNGSGSSHFSPWRLERVTQWFIQSEFYENEPPAYFGASTGAAAALVAAGTRNVGPVCAGISRGGRPDLAGVERLRKINVPVLFIVGSNDEEVLHLNQLAARELRDASVVLIRGATHLFEEPGALEGVSNRAIHWLKQHLPETGDRSSYA